jgi:hypothetical protein
LGVSAALAQKPETAPAASASSALTNPPVFQGLMVDAKGKDVGRLFLGFQGPIDGALVTSTNVVRQISKTWVSLQVRDFATGFLIVDPSQSLTYFFQSADCTGQAYFPARVTLDATAPYKGLSP